MCNGCTVKIYNIQSFQCYSVFVYVQVLGIHLNKWKLDVKLGLYALILYAIFLFFSVMIEYNVFTFVNLPMCMED